MSARGRWLLLLFTLLGLGLRLAAAHELRSHVDEAASVLAAQMVFEKGLPLYPSGVLYTQGLLLSYLELPVWVLGFGSYHHLFAARLVSALAGALAVPAVARLAMRLGVGELLALGAAFAIALDPVSVEWGAHLRPYALLQLECALMLGAWWELVQGRSRRATIELWTWFSLAVLTHVGVLMLLPAMLLVTLRQVELRERRDLLGAALGLSLAPAFLFGLNAIFGVSNRSAQARGPSFVGDHLLRLGRPPDLSPWVNLFGASFLGALLPWVMAALIGLLLGRRLLVPAPDRRVGALMALTLLPTVLVVFLIQDAQPRYLVHLQPLSWILAALALEDLWRAPPPGRWVAASVGALFGVHLAHGATSLFTVHDDGPSYHASVDWLAQLRQPGEPVAAAMTVAAWGMGIPADELHFLAGDEGSGRVSSYVRRDPEGREVDFWVGVDAITSLDELCTFFEENPGAWLVVDNMRLNSDAFTPRLARLIRGGSERVVPDGAAAAVYHVLPRHRWSADALRVCSAPLSPAAPAAAPPAPPASP